MKLKKLLSLVIASAMLLSSMAVEVFAANALPVADENGVITLTENVILSETLTISSDMTIDLNGYQITSADVSGSEKAFSPLIKIDGVSVVIKDSGLDKGSVVPGTKTDVTSYNTGTDTIVVNNGTLTVDGAVVEGQRGVNTKYPGTAIEATLSLVNIINNSVISGGVAEKKDVTADDQYNYNNEGNASGSEGKGIVSYGSDIVITDSTVNGGDGIATGTTVTDRYISGGDNFANGTAALELRGKNDTISTLTATCSVINGGDSDLYNPGDAISIQGSSEVSIISCTVTGGSVLRPISNYGIGGDALYLSGTPQVSVKGSTIIAGTGNSSTKNGALEIASSSANPTVVVENSTLIGSKYYAIGGSGKNGSFTLVDSTIKGKELIESNTISSIMVEGTLTVSEDSEGKEIGVLVYSKTGADIIGASDITEAIVFAAEINGTLYETLAEAISQAQPEDTIVLISDIVLTESIEITKDITIDLAGNDVSYVSDIVGEAMITNKGNLTISDSVGTGVINYNYTGAADSTYSKGNYTISNAGTLTVNGGKITIANLSGHAKYPIDNNSTTGDAILVINGGHLYNYNTSAIRQFCNSTTYENSVTINGGLIEGYCAIWVQNPGKNTVNGSLSITGGEIKTTAKAWVNGEAEIKDVASGIYCTIDGDGGAWSEDSAISITGGIINENVKLAEEAPKAITIGEDAVYNGYVDVSGITWDYDQDSGFYYNGGTKYGMIRFLFAAKLDGEIEQYGIRYSKADDITEEVTTDGKTVNNTGDVNAFYGDLYGVEENADTRYYAIAFIKVNGRYLWSDIVNCTPNWNNNYSGYTGGNE